MGYADSHAGYEELSIDTIRLVVPDLTYAEASLSWVQSLDVVQFMGADFPSPTIEGEQKRIREILKNTDEYSWMIEVDGKVIGNVCINSIRKTSEKHGMKAGNLTILIGDKNFWGKGIATKVCGKILEWAKVKGGFGLLTARALRENIGSIKTLRKLGFHEVGKEPYEGLVYGKPSLWHNFNIDLS